MFAGWLNPEILGTPWHEADKLILNPKVGGFFYLLHSVYPHYGRFTKIERPGRIQHTRVSPNTLGQESTVTVIFKKQAENTLMTLVHSDLPDNEGGRAHEKVGITIWEFSLGNLGMPHARRNDSAASTTSNA